jgi:methionyl-tRNA synthetase
MAKDILKFHAVIWPALLKAAGFEYPRRLAIHGFLLMGEKKMSKSLGNVLDPNDVVEKFGADALRHYCFREVSFGNDGSVSAAGFEERYEAELANEWGNLASRTLAMIERYRDGRVPRSSPDAELGGGEGGLDALPREVSELLDRAELSDALERCWIRVRRLNRYVEERRPWDLAGEEGSADALDHVLYNLAEGLRILTLMLVPYMPESTGKLLGALGESDRGPSEFGARPGGQRVEKLPPLFPKIDA